MPPFRVEYFCPSQSLSWQGGGKLFMDLSTAILTAQMVKPRSSLGRARVLDAYGNVVYEL
jgi:hypothetical protein